MQRRREVMVADKEMTVCITSDSISPEGRDKSRDMAVSQWDRISSTPSCRVGPGDAGCFLSSRFLPNSVKQFREDYGPAVAKLNMST